jgi:NAD(P)-dependent dehydrogenase (short-subunit alcohol dehydrogenase family)
MKSLLNKTALVTGGNRGIGRGIVLALAAVGANVAFTYNSNEAQAQLLREELAAKGATALSLKMASEKRADVLQVLEKTKQAFGPVDILVNNAAIAQEKSFETITDDDWNRMMDVNLRGPFTCAQEVLPGMLKLGWGRIVNISSIGGQWGGFNQVHYAASKAGLLNLTRSLAKIYSDRGITSNAVSPGLVATEMSAKELESEEGKDKITGIPMGRIGMVREIADIVVFLASDKASYITGQTINANGGMYFD